MKSYLLTELRYKLKQMTRKGYRPLLQVVLIFFISFSGINFWLSTAGQKLDQWVALQFFQHRGPRPPPADVVLVAIDDITYQKFGLSPNYPVPRSMIGEALMEIAKAAPKVAILDAAIPPERTIDPAGDDKIEAALKSGPFTIWSGKVPDNLTKNQGQIQIASDERFRKAARMELPMTVSSSDGIVWLISENPKEPKDLFEQIPIARPLAEIANYSLERPGTLDLLNFYGPSGSVNQISVSELIQGATEATRAKLKDKVVIAGYQSIVYARGTSGKDELHISASRETMYGVEIHAHIIGNLIEKSWLRSAGFNTTRIYLFIAGAVIASVCIFLSPWWSVPIVSVIALSAIGFSYREFSNLRWIPGIGTILMLCIFGAALGSFYYFSRTEGVRRYIRKTFKFGLERDL